MNARGRLDTYAHFWGDGSFTPNRVQVRHNSLHKGCDDQRLANDIRESNENIGARTAGKDAKIGGPGRTRTSNQTVMSEPRSLEKADNPDDSEKD
jgi:hypothetical protein